MSKVKETGVGILFFCFLVGMAFLTIVLTDFSLFKETHNLTAYFDKGAGLKVGDNVRIMGVIRGKVSDVEFLVTPVTPPGSDRKLYVKTELQLDVPLASFLRTDYEIRIRNSNMLGGKVVDVEMGTSPAPLPAAAVESGLMGLASTDPFEEIGDLIADNRPGIDSIIANVDSFSGDIRVLTEDIRSGEGVIHDLIYNTTMADTLRITLARALDTVEALGKITSDIKAGKGVLGQAVYNDEWPRRISSIMDDVDVVLSDVRAGKGVLGQAVYNEEWPTRITSVLANTEEIIAGARAGKGPLGLILNDEQVREDIAASISNIRGITDVANDIAFNLSEGKGLLGVLLTDQEVAMKVKALIDIALLSLEDAREAAPMSSLGSFLFGSF